MPGSRWRAPAAPSAPHAPEAGLVQEEGRGMTSHTTPAGPPRGPKGERRRLIRELLLVAGLFTVYKAGRTLSTDRTDEAFRNAARVWDAERALHLPGEGAVQRLLLHGDAVIHTANTYYAAVHFPATALFLVWLYLRRPAHYLWARRGLAVLTGAALALHLTFPLAPPRMLDTARLVDTGQVYGPTVYGAAPAADTMANQFAAMPSLHFGWALMLALGMIAATGSRWRALWLLHPLVTLLVVVGTANHYWLDAIVATVLLGGALLFVPRPAVGGESRVRGVLRPAVRSAPGVRGVLRPAVRAAEAVRGLPRPGGAVDGPAAGGTELVPAATVAAAAAFADAPAHAAPSATATGAELSVAVASGTDTSAAVASGAGPSAAVSAGAGPAAPVIVGAGR
ncbi:phosphatase PAP2 family protein [Streptomyces sp. ISL-87]|nr:phosphatase PAP2 family protein [Streptomyces sp. ISL-21]MBT2610950.1 phosphatase PAP2 family protein [Streptomyces sp. ISL-87]